MFNKILRFIVFIIALILLTIFQISAISLWPGFWGELNLVLIVIVSLLFFYNIKTSLFSALIFGLCLDVFSFNFFGLKTLSLVLALFLVHKISISWLTNKSILSLLFMNIIFSFFYMLVSSFLISFSSYEPGSFFLFEKVFWLSFLFKSSWSIILSLIFFAPLAKMSKNLRPMFLD